MFCPNGTKYADEFKCPRGTYNNQTGLQTIEECTPCAPGYYCDEEGQTTSIKKCSAGLLFFLFHFAALLGMICNLFEFGAIDIQVSHEAFWVFRLRQKEFSENLAGVFKFIVLSETYDISHSNIKVTFVEAVVLYQLRNPTNLRYYKTMEQTIPVRNANARSERSTNRTLVPVQPVISVQKEQMNRKLVHVERSAMERSFNLLTSVPIVPKV